MGFRTSGRVNLISSDGVVDDELGCELQDIYAPRCYRSWFMMRLLYLNTDRWWRTATYHMRMSPNFDVYSGVNINGLYGSQDPSSFMTVREWDLPTFIPMTEEALLS
jgi:hypothetical protein